MIKYKLTSEKSEFWKTYIYHCELDSFPMLTGFSDEIGEFLILYNKNVNIWNICITRWTNFFSKYQYMRLQNHT